MGDKLENLKMSNPIAIGLANWMSASMEAMGLVFIHCSLFIDPFDLSMSLFVYWSVHNV